jgi:hypothetical protein
MNDESIKTAKTFGFKSICLVCPAALYCIAGSVLQVVQCKSCGHIRTSGFSTTVRGLRPVIGFMSDVKCPFAFESRDCRLHGKLTYWRGLS